MDKWITNLSRKFSRQTITASEVKPAPLSEQVNNTLADRTSSDSEEETEKVSQAPVPKSEGEGGGGAVVRTSSAEKRQHSVYKQLTSCSSSSSSDDELKELQLGDGDGTKRHVHVRHKPPQKERKIVSLSSTSPDDDEVFSYSKPGCVAKRLKCSAPQPIPGRYTDFDKMRRTPMLQVSKARRLQPRRDPGPTPQTYTHFGRAGPVFPPSFSPFEASRYSFRPIALSPQS